MGTPSSIISRDAFLLLLTPGLPFAWAMLLAASRREILQFMAPWAAFPGLLAALLLPAGTFVDLPWIMLQARMGLDSTGRVFLLFTSLLWLLSTMDAWGSMGGKSGRREFLLFMLLAMGGNLGLIVAQDLFSFYVAFALMSFSSYGLVVYYRSEESLRAGRVYMVLVVVGEILVFTSLLMIHRSAGTALLSNFSGMARDPWILGLVFAGFGIKAGAIPLHVWLPLAHPAAPTHASAVLSGAMIKAGLLGWMRFLPLGGPALPEWGALFIGAGLLASLGGVGIGLTQRNLKTILAYSSISQMGLMTVGVGISLMLPEKLPQSMAAVTVYACHHGLTKGSLFLGVGLVQSVPRDSRRWAWVLAGMGFAALALAGLPMTGGFLAKGLLKDVAGAPPHPWGGLLSTFLPLSAWASTLLMLRFLFLASRVSGSSGVSTSRWISYVATLVSVAILTWLLPEGASWRGHALEPDRWWMAIWPLAMGFVAALALVVFLRRTGISFAVAVPPGDILVVGEILLKPVRSALTLMSAVESSLDRGVSVCLLERCRKAPGVPVFTAARLKLLRTESILLGFTVAGILFLLVLVALLLLFWRPGAFG